MEEMHKERGLIGGYFYKVDAVEERFSVLPRLSHGLTPPLALGSVLRPHLTPHAKIARPGAAGFGERGIGPLPAASHPRSGRARLLPGSSPPATAAKHPAPAFGWRQRVHHY